MRTFLLLALAATAAAAQTTQGDFRSADHAYIRIENCGPNICARLIQLPPDAPARLDIHNPDATLRSRPLCGLIIGSGFHQDDPTHLSGGYLYDPKSGHTYRGTLTAVGDTLKLHGYIGLSFLGRTEVWQRVPATVACH